MQCKDNRKEISISQTSVYYSKLSKTDIILQWIEIWENYTTNIRKSMWSTEIVLKQHGEGDINVEFILSIIKYFIFQIK